MRYRVRIFIKSEIPDQSIKVHTDTFSLATQVAENAASQGYTQKVTETLWMHYLPSDILKIWIEKIPSKERNGN